MTPPTDSKIPASQPGQGLVPLACIQQPCPVCRAQHGPDVGDFCEECGYNFKSATPHPLATVVAEPIVASTAPEIQPTPPAQSQEPPPDILLALPEPVPAMLWELVAIVDPLLRGPADPDAPATEPERIFPLTAGDQLIGRRNVRRNISADINFDSDDGVSHRHAKIVQHSDGSFTLSDLNSSNGTFLNGKEIRPNVAILLSAGDQIGLGRWTRLTIRTRSL